MVFLFLRLVYFFIISFFLFISWYTFDWSNSVYSTVSISLFIPLFLVNLAETHATCGQRLVSCPTNVTTLALGAMDGTLTQCTQCFPGLGTKLLNFTAGFEAGLTTQDFKDALLSWPGPFTGGVLRDSPISYFIDVSPSAGREETTGEQRVEKREMKRK